MREVILLLGLELGRPRSHIKKWKQRGYVPHKFRLQMLALAKKHGWPLTERDFEFEPSLPKEREKLRQRQQAAA